MIEYVNLGGEERNMVDLMEKAIATYEAEMAYAKRRATEQGHAEGLAEGSERAAREARAVAARLLAMGVDRAVVVEATGLADSELDTLP
jgi:predicted transposase/invertase (TIGR01784 family)